MAEEGKWGGDRSDKYKMKRRTDGKMSLDNDTDEIVCKLLADDEAPEMVVMRPGVDERSSRWVAFPHLGKQYFLRVYYRDNKIIPKFTDSGIELETIHPDPDLTKLVNDLWANLIASEENPVIRSLEEYGSFLRLVRRLLQRNYTYSDDEVAGMLVMTTPQLSKLYSAIVVHLRDQ